MQEVALVLAFVPTRIDASFLQGLCLEEGYNIVAAHTQKPMPPLSNHCRHIVAKLSPTPSEVTVISSN